MTAVIVGLSFIACGIWGLIHWFPSVLIVVKGLGAISLIVGGAIAVLAGMSSLKTLKAVRADAPKE